MKQFILLFFVFISTLVKIKAQQVIYNPENICQFYEIKVPDSLKEYCESCKNCGEPFKGHYSYKSINNSWRKMAGKKIIKSENTATSISHEDKFLIPDKKGIVLFKKIRPKNSADIAGILYDPTFVKVELIQKMARYEYVNDHPNDEVWSTVKINNVIYYTDASIVRCHYWSGFYETDTIEYYNKPMPEYKQHFYFLDINDPGECITYHNVLIIEETGNHFKIKYTSPKITFHWNCECGTAGQGFGYDKTKKAYAFNMNDAYQDDLVCYWDGKNFSYVLTNHRSTHGGDGAIYEKHYSSKTNKIIKKTAKWGDK